MIMPGIIAEHVRDAAWTGVKTCEIRLLSLPEVILFRSCNAPLRYTCCLTEAHAPKKPFVLSVARIAREVEA